MCVAGLIPRRVQVICKNTDNTTRYKIRKEKRIGDNEARVETPMVCGWESELAGLLEVVLQV